MCRIYITEAPLDNLLVTVKTLQKAHKFVTINVFLFFTQVFNMNLVFLLKIVLKVCRPTKTLKQRKIDRFHFEITNRLGINIRKIINDGF